MPHQGLSIQETYAPHNACFGCGPANAQGLGLKSFIGETGLLADWKALPLHEAFPGVLNGGIIGALLDCHSNWTAAWHLMEHNRLKTPPCTVTADFHVVLLRPTPSEEPIHLTSHIKRTEGDKVLVGAELRVGERVCATCTGHFVAVKPGHPAYHRW